MENKDGFQFKIAEYIAGLKDEIVESDENKVVEGRDIDVVIRARPLLAHELENNYFEVIHSQKHTFHYMDPSLSLKKEPRLKVDAHQADFSFGQTDSNEMVY